LTARSKNCVRIEVLLAPRRSTVTHGGEPTPATARRPLQRVASDTAFVHTLVEASRKQPANTLLKLIVTALHRLRRARPRQQLSSTLGGLFNIRLATADASFRGPSH
ncbi:MAG: hypothetical protein KDB14_07320, partial [Planctomycetales bacterium]|nr:hypothetical protein [Planctomycetales bacterium]